MKLVGNLAAVVGGAQDVAWSGVDVCGKGQCDICAADNYYCNGAELQQCIGGLSFKHLIDCPTAALCDSTAGACINPTCSVGETRCETAGDPKGKLTGKFTKPPQDLKPAILGSVFAGVPVPKGEKFFRWEVGVPLKGIKELNADDAQKAIQRALGGLLEATPVSAPVPVAPPQLEVAPKPNGVLEEGK